MFVVCVEKYSKYLNKMKDVSVIGSGIGGLASALRFAAKGYDVTVFEKAETIGGKIGELKMGGYRFDTGPSLFTLPQLVYELFELFGKDARDYIDVVSLNMTCNYFFPDGTNLKAWSKHDKFVEEVQKSGIERSVIENYLGRQSFLYTHTSDFFLFNSIHKASTFTGEAGQRSLKALHKLDAFKTMNQRNVQTFGDGNVAQLFNRYATYNGSNPYEAPATLNMIAHLEHNTGAFFPLKGMRGIVESLAKLAEEEGVKINTSEGVQSIQQNIDKSWRLTTHKSTYQSDVVVNDTDVTYFYKNILPDAGMYRKLSKRERSSSALIFYWGMNLSTELDVHNILFSNNYKAEFDGLFKTKVFANDLTVYIFISKKVVETDAPDGKENWFVMVNAPENVGQDWQHQIDKARKIILAKINSMLNLDVESLIENEDVTTPADIEARTASVNGSLYGHSSNSAMAAFLRHPNFSRKYKNLYFVGGSIHPGGGIPLCLASAKIVDNLI